MNPIETVRRLISVARSVGETPEGKTAKALAERKLAQMGLTEDEVMRTSIQLDLETHPAIWKLAIIETICLWRDVGLSISTINDSKEYHIHGSSSSLGIAHTTIEQVPKQIDVAAASFRRRASMLFGHDEIIAEAEEAFLCAAASVVLGRLLDLVFERFLAEAASGEGEGEGEEDDIPTSGEVAMVDDAIMSQAASLFEAFEKASNGRWPSFLDPIELGTEAGAKVVLQAPFPSVSLSSSPLQLEEAP